MMGERYIRLGIEGAVAILVISLVLGTVLGQPIGLGYVETGSMAPTLEPGDGFIAVPPAFAGDIEEGDVVTFRAKTLQGGGLTTHRIAGRTDGGYLTHGDSNPFVDQQTGEPPVRRSQIVSVALQIGEQVVVVPSLGALVAGSQGLLSSVGTAIGVGEDPSRLGAVLVATLGAAYLLDELFGSTEDERTAERQMSRDTGFSSKALIVVGLVVVLVIATLSMTVPTGTSSIPFDSVESEEVEGGGVSAGTSKIVSLQLSNRGLIPLATILDTPNGAPLSKETVVLGPRDSETVNVTLTAPSEPGTYEQQIIQYRYLGILPTSVIGLFHGIHPWLAIVTLNVFLGTLLLVVGRFLLGHGRIRLRSGRCLPLKTSVRRAFRRLYR